MNQVSIILRKGKKFNTMEGPVRMVDGFGNLLGVLRLNVFPVSDHSRFYAMTSIF